MAAPNFPKLEEDLLKEWEEKKIFEKTLAKDAPKGSFVFFEGPPTANGKPGIHHVLARAFKDLIPRFKTMQGYRVDRKAGWDTHGLPVELEVEKQLGLKNKKEVEAYGVEAFNKKCKESVWKYLDEWQKMTRRMAYWIDMEHPYVTYHNDYIEKLWGVFKKIDKSGYLYKGHRVTPHCPRCVTSLSSHELAQGYKDTQDPSVYVKFEMESPVPADATDKMYLLVWTTTPWTLSANVALAVGEDIDYVEVRLDDASGHLILAKDRLSVLDHAHTVVSEMKGKDLVSKRYIPPYFAPIDAMDEKKHAAYQIYSADFVSTTDGTGIVHIAPAFGEDDANLAKVVGLPTAVTVDNTGAVSYVDKPSRPWKGKFFKDADVDIKEDLHNRGLLYKSETITHSYPFCWRCGTPILYYAKDSWYFAVSKLREALLTNNAQVNWEPAHIKEGRFGEWLSGIKDWAISRERYWGTPLPIWECGSCEKTHAVGSLEEMDQMRLRKNRFFVVRHGEALSNTNGFLSSWPEQNGNVHLTEAGEKKVRETAAILRKEGIDLIVSSDLKRTKQTAEIIAEATGAELMFDERLREIGFGAFNGRSEKEYHDFFGGRMERLTRRPEGGENYEDVRKRIVEAVLELDRKHDGKTIVVVSHGDPIWFLTAAAQNKWNEALWDVAEAHYLDKGVMMELHMPNWPFDTTGAVDVHRPYIDQVLLRCPHCQSGTMSRIKDVMDVWFDSGAMPFAADVGYPADFISEAIDQTRGWFYTLLAVATLMGKDKPPYKNVICLGHLLDTKGQKMSKSKGNVVDPWKMFEKYGADAVRFHLYTVNAPGEPKRFDEKAVDEVVKKVFLVLWNCLSFYKMFAGNARTATKAPKSDNILDKWILSKLSELVDYTTKNLGGEVQQRIHLNQGTLSVTPVRFDVLNAGRDIATFINELSTWYVRRNRDRFKDGDNKEAVETLGYTLLTLSKLMAPFTPFFAEALYKELGGAEPSVHLENWPKIWTDLDSDDRYDPDLNNKMDRVRQAASMALEKRAAAKINVRQALAALVVKSEWPFEDWMLETLADEVNVKEALHAQSAGFEVELDTALTPELKREGAARELTRNLNSLRKEAKLTIEDRVVIHYETESLFWKDVIKEYGAAVQKDTRAEAWHTGRPEATLMDTEIEFDEEKMWIGIVKA